MKPRHVVLACALCVAAYLALFADKTAVDMAHAAARPAAATASSSRPATVREAPVRIMQVVEREQLFPKRERQGADALFQARSWASTSSEAASAPAPSPSAPPVPYAYIGKQQEEGRWRVYLARDGLTHVVQTGDVLDKAYRIEAIKPPVLTMTYLPLDQIQNLDIE